jgi:hypothetical protein
MSPDPGTEDIKHQFSDFHVIQYGQHSLCSCEIPIVNSASITAIWTWDVQKI